MCESPGLSSGCDIVREAVKVKPRQRQASLSFKQGIHRNRSRVMAWAWGFPLREPMRAISEKEYQRVKNVLSCSSACDTSTVDPFRTGCRRSKQKQEPLVRHLAASVPEGLSEAGKRNILFRFCMAMELEEKRATNDVSAEDSGGEIARDSLFTSLDNLVLRSSEGPRCRTFSAGTQFSSSSAPAPARLMKEECVDLSSFSESDDAAVGLTLIFVPDLETLKVKVDIPISFSEDNTYFEVALIPTQPKRYHQMSSQRARGPEEEDAFFFRVGRSPKELKNCFLRLRELLPITYLSPDVVNVAPMSTASVDEYCAEERRPAHATAFRQRSISESEYIRIRDKETKANDGYEDVSSSGITSALSTSPGRHCDVRFSSRILRAKEFNSAQDIDRNRPCAVTNPFGDTFAKVLSEKIGMVKKKIFTEQQQQPLPEAAMADKSSCSLSLLHESSRGDSKRQDSGQTETLGGAEAGAAKENVADARVIGEAVLRLKENIWAGTSASLRHTCRLQLLKPQNQSTGSQQHPELGKLQVLLQYQSKADRIKVIVVQASGLPSTLFKPEDLVVVRLLHKDNVVAERRTCTRPGACPTWKEALPFSLAGNHLASYSLQLVVMRRRLLASDHVIGHVILGTNGGVGEAEPSHWKDMSAAPEQEIARWHHIVPPLSM